MAQQKKTTKKAAKKAVAKKAAKKAPAKKAATKKVAPKNTTKKAPAKKAAAKKSKPVDDQVMDSIAVFDELVAAEIESFSEMIVPSEKKGTIKKFLSWLKK